MPLYRKIEHEMILQKADNFVASPTYTIEAAGKTKSSILPDGWKFFDTDAEAVADLNWPIHVPMKSEDPAGFTEYIASRAFEDYVTAFTKMHGYLPTIAEEAAS